MDVKLPNLGEGADSGVVVNVFVKEGDRVAKDQPILELENEKAVASIPSSAAGVVSKVHVKAGDKVNVGQRLLTLSREGAGGGREGEPAKGRAGTGRKAEAPEAGPVPESAEQGETEDMEAEGDREEPTSGDEAPAQPGIGPAAAPSLRKLAADLGIDLARVKGSARGGRIVLADVRAYIQRLQKLAAQPRAAAAPTAPITRPPAESIDFSKWGPVRKQPLSQLRKVISRRMSESWSTIPHVTQFDDVDVTGLLELRKKLLPAYEKQGTRLTLTAFVLKALAAVLKQHPVFNASLDEATEEIVFKDYCHIGIAVDTEAGLIVPVLRDVDRKDLLTLSKELDALAQKARERKVAADELKGGTFTISNQGGIGGAHFTPIVNKPEVAILGLGRGTPRPVVRDGRIEPRTLMPIALSYDHRLIDGGSAARFTVDLVKALEQFPEADARA